MRISIWSSVRVSVAIFIGVITAMSHDIATAQESSQSGILIMMSGGFAFPTSRFGEKQASASTDTSKAGHQNGHSLRIDVGYNLSRFLAVGIRSSQTSFDIDFPNDQNAPDPNSLELARTTIDIEELWMRVFPVGTIRRWRPYVVIGAGLGHPKSTIRTLIGTEEIVTSVFTVSTSFAFSAGAGAFIPLKQWAKIALEAQYQQISAKGSDIEFCISGLAGEFCDIDFGKAKSNTTWWEIRGGIVFTM